MTTLFCSVGGTGVSSRSFMFLSINLRSTLCKCQVARATNEGANGQRGDAMEKLYLMFVADNGDYEDSKPLPLDVPAALLEAESSARRWALLLQTDGGYVIQKWTGDARSS